MRVRKNDGRYQEFDKSKIAAAIEKAASEVGVGLNPELPKRVAADVERELGSRGKATVKADDISELVENKLMASNQKDVARCYIRYRYDREKERLQNSKLIKDFKRKLDGVNVENQNANLDERSFSGRMNEAARVLLKDDALSRMSKMARDNHVRNLIYTHDLDSYSSGQTNCLSVPIDALLENGFSTRQADVRSPRSVLTALQLVAVLMQLQSLQQFGGVSATHLDWSMVPYVRYSLLKHFATMVAYDNESDDVDGVKKLLMGIIFEKAPSYGFSEDSVSKSSAANIDALIYDVHGDFMGLLESILEEEAIDGD